MIHLNPFLQRTFQHFVYEVDELLEVLMVVGLMVGGLMVVELLRVVAVMDEVHLVGAYQMGVGLMVEGHGDVQNVFLLIQQILEIQQILLHFVCWLQELEEVQMVGLLMVEHH